MISPSQPLNRRWEREGDSVHDGDDGDENKDECDDGTDGSVTDRL